MRHFNSVNLIHLLLQINAKPALGDSKPDRLLRLNRHATLLYEQASREAGQNFSTNSHYLDKEKNAISARVTAELMRVNLTNHQQFNAVFKAIENWQPDRAYRQCQIVRKALLTLYRKSGKNRHCRRSARTIKRT